MFAIMSNSQVEAMNHKKNINQISILNQELNLKKAEIKKIYIRKLRSKNKKKN